MLLDQVGNDIGMGLSEVMICTVDNMKVCIGQKRLQSLAHSHYSAPCEPRMHASRSMRVRLRAMPQR
jgi:hypothetical protein